MSAVNEWVVREYFESVGYLVSQPRKYVPNRPKTADEEVDLVVFNPQIVEHRLPEYLVWATEDLRTVSRAIVGIRGWHTERFYVSTIEQTPELLRFVEKDAIRFAGKILGSSAMAKILCLPRLPASGELKEQTIRVLKGKGVDGIISFQTMLLELIGRVDKNKNYEKSDLLQILRLLKNYDLIKGSQMDMFGRLPRSRKERTRKSADTNQDGNRVSDETKLSGPTAEKP